MLSAWAILSLSVSLSPYTRPALSFNLLSVAWWSPPLTRLCRPADLPRPACGALVRSAVAFCLMPTRCRMVERHSVLVGCSRGRCLSPSFSPSWFGRFATSVSTVSRACEIIFVRLIMCARALSLSSPISSRAATGSH